MRSLKERLRISFIAMKTLRFCAVEVLTHDVLRDQFFLLGAREQKCEGVADQVAETRHDLILLSLPRRPLEVGIGNRVSVRIVRWKAECPVDSRLELLGDHVLEPVGLVMHGIDVQAECLREIELEQAVVANDLDGNALAARTQPGAAIRLVLEQPERRELLHHRGRRRRRHALFARQRSDRDTVGALLKLVDPFQVILDRPRRAAPWSPTHLTGGTVNSVPIRVGHSADPDDAFMFWALEAGG